MTKKSPNYGSLADDFIKLLEAELDSEGMQVQTPEDIKRWLAISPPELRVFLTRLIEHYGLQGDDSTFKATLESLAIAVGVV